MTHQPPSDSFASAASAEAPAPGGPRWSARKQTEFLRALAATHSVKAAARAVGMSRQSAYRLRSRLKGQAFDFAWDEAFHHSYHNLPYAALERAMNGTEVPHYYKGELIGTSRRYDERLTVALLKLYNTSDVLIVGGLDPQPEITGRRLEILLNAIETEHDDPVETHPDGDFAADSREVSPAPTGGKQRKKKGLYLIRPGDTVSRLSPSPADVAIGRQPRQC